MAENLDTLITALRGATLKDSVSPDNIGYLLQAIRNETSQLIAQVSQMVVKMGTEGQVDLEPLTSLIGVLSSQIESLEGRVTTHINAADPKLDKIAGLCEKVETLARAVSTLRDQINDATVSVEAPALLPFYGINETGINAIAQSYTGETRILFDAVNGRFVAQAPNSQGIFTPASLPGACYLGGDAARYNSAGKARTDLLYVYEEALYSYDGEKLVKHTTKIEA